MLLVINEHSEYVLVNGSSWYVFKPTDNGGMRVIYRSPDPTRRYDVVTDIEDARKLWRYLTSPRKGYTRW